MTDETVVPGSPEYEAAMVAKFDSHNNSEAEVTTEAPQVVTRPEHIPEKFWDAEKGEVRLEALAKSYAELEKSRGKPPAEKAPGDTTDNTPPPAEADAAKAALEAQGFDYSNLSQEFLEHGDITEETRAALAAKGFTKEVVDSHIAGQQALAREWQNAGYEVVGGKEQYSKMVEWAASNLSQAEKVAFNTATDTSDVEQMKLAVSGLKQRYESANGKAPGLLTGSNSGDSNQGYESRAQMLAEMKDPRYAKDEAFRKQVENKLKVTTSF